MYDKDFLVYIILYSLFKKNVKNVFFKKDQIMQISCYGKKNCFHIINQIMIQRAGTIVNQIWHDMVGHMKLKYSPLKEGKLR